MKATIKIFFWLKIFGEIEKCAAARPVTDTPDRQLSTLLNMAEHGASSKREFHGNYGNKLELEIIYLCVNLKEHTRSRRGKLEQNHFVNNLNQKLKTGRRASVRKNTNIHQSTAKKKKIEEKYQILIDKLNNLFEQQYCWDKYTRILNMDSVSCQF